MPKRSIVFTIALRTFRHYVESPIAYVLAFFFYGFLGSVMSLTYFGGGQASIDSVVGSAPWVLWFMVPALTMGLFSEELKTGTFEPLATLPLTDWDIVLGKFGGFALLSAFLMGGLLFYPILVSFTATSVPGQDWGAALGSIAALYFLCLTYGALGLFASSLSKSQVVALIVGMLFCTGFFFIGQFAALLPGALSPLADMLGILSKVDTLSRGVWDVRDLFYFFSLIFLALLFTVQKLATRRM